MTNYRNRATTI